jgi:hypothetical protein
MLIIKYKYIRTFTKNIYYLKQFKENVLQEFYNFLSQKVNQKTKNGQKKCPILKRAQRLLQKTDFYCIN